MPDTEVSNGLELIDDTISIVYSYMLTLLL